MGDLDFSLKMHKSTFSIDEDMSNFIRDNFDNSKERLDFLQGGFEDYMPDFHTPKMYFHKMFDLLFDAYERKEPFLVKLLSHKNVEKMLAITKRVSDVDDLSLSSSGWLNLKDSVNYDDSFG